MHLSKTLLLLASAALLAAASCKKDDDSGTTPTNPSGLPALNSFVSDGVTYAVEYDTVYLNKQNDSETSRSYFFGGRTADKKQSAELAVSFINTDAVPTAGTYPIASADKAETARDVVIIVNDTYNGKARKLQSFGKGTTANITVSATSGKLFFTMQDVTVSDRDLSQTSQVKVSANVQY